MCLASINIIQENMRYNYLELKEYIDYDFSQYLNDLDFTEQYVLPAVLDDYGYHKDFCETEKICVHLFLLDHYLETGWDGSPLKKTLLDLLPADLSGLKEELGEEYPLFVSDYSRLVKDIHKL